MSDWSGDLSVECLKMILRHFGTIIELELSCYSERSLVFVVIMTEIDSRILEPWKVAIAWNQVMGKYKFNKTVMSDDYIDCWSS